MKKKLIILMLLISMLANGNNVNARLSDRARAINFAHTMYCGLPVHVVSTNKLTTHRITHRKGKEVIIEKIVSRSHGYYGIFKGKYKILYNRKAKYGKKVTSYCVYSPCNNYIDDVTCVIDNGKER